MHQERERECVCVCDDDDDDDAKRCHQPRVGVVQWPSGVAMPSREENGPWRSIGMARHGADPQVLLSFSLSLSLTAPSGSGMETDKSTGRRRLPQAASRGRRLCEG
jgi:hypothetical protein